MKKLFLTVLSIALLSFAGSAAAEDTKKTDKLDGAMEGLIAKVLLNDKLELVEGTDIVVSYLEVPPNTTLPSHWHHGEEYIYVLEGSAVVVLKDKPDTIVKKGEVFKIPLKHVHTAKTTDEPCKVVVFRVHEEGKPVRVDVE